MTNIKNFLGTFNFLNGFNNYKNMKSILQELKDQLKNKFILKLKTGAVTRSYTNDFEKVYPKNGSVFDIVRKPDWFQSRFLKNSQILARKRSRANVVLEGRI